MNKSEVKELLRMISEIYPSFRIDDPLHMIDTWHMVLSDEPVAKVRGNLVAFVKSGKKFPPSAAELVVRAAEIVDSLIPNKTETREMLDVLEQHRTKLEAIPEEVRKGWITKARAEINRIYGGTAT